ncbi:pleckstrin homology domain-containing family G member 5-like isoform X2 [Limulus polyphemus]|uniref:Pleckstrin homology domain-containing family G member 5-like isoform X2 n=1 Tax=Limulus polyphemus TaxID=6850 RepID=A0ABM1SS90_LIMPO|nr:pleckstrin homology domain-containing family G member 5-like isoform X2 [Limulus polyphemus]
MKQKLKKLMTYPVRSTNDFPPTSSLTLYASDVTSCLHQPTLREEVDDDYSVVAEEYPGLTNAVSLPSDINFTEEDETRMESADGFSMKRYRNVEKLGSKQKILKIKKNKLSEVTQRSKSLTQIDCLDSPETTITESNVNIKPEMNTRWDHFTVTLEMLDDNKAEKIPATSGVCLREVIKDLLVKRGLDLDIQDVSVFLDASKTPLPSDGDCFLFGGKHLRIQTKHSPEGAVITRENSTGSTCVGASSNRSNSGSLNRDDKSRKVSAIQHGGRKTGLLASSEDLSDPILPGPTVSLDTTLKSSRGRSTLSRKPGIFSNVSKTEKEKTELLMELLNNYTVNGIPQQPGLPTFELSQENTYRLEPSWKDIVENWEALSERMKAQQNAIWELIQTEIFFIKRLKVIIELYLACLYSLQAEGVLNEINSDKLFSNIREVYVSNHQFWVKHLLPMLTTSRTTKQKLNPVLMKDGFLQCVQLFRPYIKYCTEHNRCVEYVKQRNKENELFKAYVTWCESWKECDRLQLADILVKPMQRLTKYTLLLKAILKKTDDEEQVCPLIEMIKSMESFVQTVDSIMLRQNEKKRLASIINRIDSYDVIDSNNEELDKAMREQGNLHLDLTCPMPGCVTQLTRQLVKEGGAIKLRETSSGKVDVHCFLFTDMFLICKPLGKRGDKVRVIRQPYLVERLKVQELKDGGGLTVIYLNEFHVATAAFILYTHEPKIWLESIRRAQELYQEAKKTSELGFDLMDYTEEDELLSSGHLATSSSSHSSLIHSHTESVDTSSDPVSTNSIGRLSISPVSSRTSQNHSKAVSFELGSLRNPSLAKDSEHEKPRAHSFETRTGPVSVTVTSPPTDYKAETSLTLKTWSKGTENLFRNRYGSEISRTPRSIQIPFIPETLKTDGLLGDPLLPTVKTTIPQNQAHKPPLLKTRHVFGQISSSATASEEWSQVSNLESNDAITRSIISNSVLGVGDLDPRMKMMTVDDRRYHTTSSAEIRKREKERDSRIHKRFSWNSSRHKAEVVGFEASDDGKLDKNTCSSKCLSSDSIYSSSGIESSNSSFYSVGEQECPTESNVCSPEILNDGDRDKNYGNNSQLPKTSSPDLEPKPNFTLNVSEMMDGITSVQINLTGGSNLRNKVDLRRMKELILNSYSVEASEV